MQLPTGICRRQSDCLHVVVVAVAAAVAAAAVVVAAAAAFAAAAVDIVINDSGLTTDGNHLSRFRSSARLQQQQQE